MDVQVAFNPVWPWPLVLLAAAALLVFSHWSYSSDAPARRLLLALRWLAIALAVLPLLRPSVVFTKKHKQSSVLVILADKSRSMLLRDMWDDQTRWQALKRLLGESEDAIAELSQEVQIRQLSFARSLGEGLDLATDPDGEQTGIGASLQELIQRSAGERLAGIVLLSDGANTTGVAPGTVARQLAGYKTPIHAFGFGRETASEKVRDIAARSIVANPTVFAKNKMTVRGEFSTAGFTDQPIGVKLMLNGVEKARGQIETKAGAERAMIDLTAIPDAPGDVKVTLEADPLPGELLPVNNSISTYVTVLSGGISVLEIEGKYRYWEPKFLRWALDQSPDIELSQLYLLDSTGKEETLPPDFFAPGKFDVVILGDVSRRRFTDAQLSALAQMVQRGGGLLMVGGYESFGPGDWGASPIADLLPVRVEPSHGQLPSPLKMEPTPAGMRHFLLRLAQTPEQNALAWKALRPLDGGSVLGELKPGALLLASTPEGVPLLAAQDVGAGRVAAFAGDTTWRWRKDDAGVAAHARFWRQVILWLAHKEEASGVNVRVRLPQRRLAIAQRLPIEVFVENAQGAPVPDATIQAVVEAPGGAQVPVELFRQGDGFRGAFWQTDVDGDYTLKVVATEGTSVLGSRTVKFLVYAEDTEMQQLAADLSSLRNLAQITSGEFHTPEDLPKFLRSLRTKDLNLEISQPVVESLWDQWPWFVVFLAVVSIEWIVRKRNGMA